MVDKTNKLASDSIAALARMIAEGITNFFNRSVSLSVMLAHRHAPHPDLHADRV